MKKIIFVLLDLEFIGPHDIKHLSKMLFVFLCHFRVNQNIIHKYQHEHMQMFTKQSIHQCHKYGWSICESKRNHNKLIVS